MENPEPSRTGGRQGGSRGEKETSTSERRNDAGRAQCHMCWTVAKVGHARPVWYRAAPWRGLAPGTVTTATPCAGTELELLRLAHLNRADMYLKLASLSTTVRARPLCTSSAPDAAGPRRGASVARYESKPHAT
jgi:hypothetical protein